MKVLNLLPIFIVFLLVLSCTKENQENTSPDSIARNGYWLVNFDEILYWGDPHDEISSIDEPEFIRVDQSDWNPGDRMFVLHSGDSTKVYPMAILEEHEIVNDQIEGLNYAVSYCPITGSGIAWDRTFRGEVNEFGVSGMLFNDNLVPYDRNTNSYWSQMLMLCINGELIETEPSPVLLFETTFDFVLQQFPKEQILVDSQVTGYANNHSASDYKNNRGDIEPGGSNGSILDGGKFYYGIINAKRSLVLDPGNFDPGLTVFSTIFMGRKYIIAGNSHFIVSFDATMFADRTFLAVDDQFPVIMSDDTGNYYTIFGKIINGPDKGLYLKPGRGYLAKGFAWESIFNVVELYE